MCINSICHFHTVMCMAMDSEKSSIVAGSATNIVEKVYFSKVKLIVIHLPNHY